MEISTQGYEDIQEYAESVKRYVEHRVPPGGFLEAVLSNDLFGAVGRADHRSMEQLGDIVRFIYNRVPNGVFGTQDKVNRHLQGTR